MVYKEFQGLKLSALGFGMMRLPVIDGKDDQIDEEKTAEIIDYAYQHGVNYYDTAWGYHSGNSELVCGRVLSKYPRESFYLASKFPGYDVSNMDKVKEIFERQLEKCQTPYFDFYLIHNVNEENIDPYLDEKFGILEYMLEQKKNGRIKHLGFSAHGSIAVMKRFLEVYGPYMEFCQLQINYMDWHFQDADKKYELITNAGIPVWIMEPVRGGKLATMPAAMKEELANHRPEESEVGWAFRFTQSLPEVKVVLSGMSDFDQVKDNIHIWSEEKPLSDTEKETLLTLIDEEVKKGALPCTACRYCTTYCPKGIDIPQIISLYNEHKITGGGFIAPMVINSMPEDKRPAACVGCRSCEKVCPQNIKISEMMQDFTAML
ncbi:MAG: aldo/keto reductase [Eubacteriales bacterium]|nr:aldo/keto reductase [Lachnospiraceae bacterium]MDO5127464.1 aldo/keto reductase [Eubacteriales bacterium]